MTEEVVRAEIPLGPNGIWGSRNLATTPPGFLIEANSVDFYGEIISKEGGALRYSSAGGILPNNVTVLGGYDWWPSLTAAEPVIIASNGNIRKDTGNNGVYTTTLASGLSNTQVSPVFVEGGKEAAANNRKLFIFTGENSPRVISGVAAGTAPAIATPPADWGAGHWPTFGFIYNSRLWAGGNANDPHRLYYSLNTNHEDFTSAGSGSLSIYAGVGEKLIAAADYKGFIIAFKYPRGIFAIDARDPTITNWSVQTHSRSIGLAGANAWCFIDDDLMFMDTSGQILVMSRIDQATISARSISDQEQMRDFITTNVDTTRLWAARCVYYAYKREVHFALTSPGGGGVNNFRLILDLNKPGVVKFRSSNRDICESLWLQKDSSLIERPFIGDNTGAVWRLDYDSQTKEGGYTAEFQTGYTDFAYVDPKLATLQKNGRWLELTFEQVGAYYLYVDVYWDELFSETLTFKMGTVNFGFTYTFPFNFTQRGKLKTERARLIGSGRRFSIVVRNANVNETFRLAHATLGFVPGSERVD